MFQVFILLRCRSPYSAEFRNEWIDTSDPTFAMNSSKRLQLIHEYNFDILKLDIHTVYYKCIKLTFYSNIPHTLKNYKHQLCYAARE
jgi:hypothetical protein